MGIWVLGIVLELCATIAGTVGKQLIRYSAVDQGAALEGDSAGGALEAPGLRSTGNKAHPHRCSGRAAAFKAGLAINVFGGPLLELSAYAFASQSLLAPFGGLDTVWNALAAPYTLGEKLTVRRKVGITIIMIGTVCSALFGRHEEDEFTVESLKGILLTWRTFWYVGIFTAWFAVNTAVILVFPKGSFPRGLSLGLMGGTLAGNMWCVKATMALVSAAFRDGFADVFGVWLPYATSGTAVVIAVTNVVFLTKGMQENEALFMVSVFEGSMIVANSASGCIVMREMDQEEAWKLTSYIFCICLVVVGLLVLISGEEKNDSSVGSHTAQESTKEVVDKTPTKGPQVTSSASQSNAPLHIGAQTGLSGSDRSLGNTAMRSTSSSSIQSVISHEILPTPVILPSRGLVLFEMLRHHDSSVPDERAGLWSPLREPATIERPEANAGTSATPVCRSLPETSFSSIASTAQISPPPMTSTARSLSTGGLCDNWERVAP